MLSACGAADALLWQTRSFFLNCAKQRILAGTGEIYRLFRFHCGYLVRICAGYAHALVVDLEHDGKGVRFRAVKNVLEHENNELHRRKIIIMEDDLEQLWLFEFGLAFCQDLAILFDVCEPRHNADLITDAAVCGMLYLNSQTLAGTVALRSSLPQPTRAPRTAETTDLTITQYITCR